MPDIQNIPTTQYIGPRIIPHLWDPILWDAETQYDALAVVQYEGAGYVARYVPPQGTLPTDAEYWVRWSDFNAQLAQLQQTVQTFDNRITANTEAVATEVGARETADGALDGRITSNAQAIEDEVTARQQAIEDEVTARQQAVSEEASAREAADEALDARITSNAQAIEDMEGRQFDAYEKQATSPNDNVVMRNGGGTVVANKTYGRYGNATAGAFMAGGDTEPDVLGNDTLGLATYLNRDSVGLFTRNNMEPYVLYVTSGVTYSADGCVLPANIDMTQIRPGMVLDSGERSQVNSTWYVGIVSKVDGDSRTLYLEDGWYLCRNDGVTPTKGTPSNTNVLYVSHVTKIWGQNTNIHTESGMPAGCCHEYEIHNTGAPNDLGFIDCMLNSDTNINYGIRIRSTNTNHPVAAFQSIGENAAAAVAGYSDASTKNFDIDNLGRAHGLKHHAVSLTAQTAANLTQNDLFILAQGSSLILPKGASGTTVIVLVLATSGCTITSPNSTAFVRSSGNVAGATGFPVTRANNFALTLISDGNSWYVIE